MTGIEEIVKYQQELLNHQRNQKLIQKETIKLLNALNKNITFMSDRLDEFALRTNIKLEANICPTNTAQQIHPINISTLQELNNVTNGAENFFNSYDSTFNNLISGTSNQLAPITATPVTNQTISLNDEIKEYYILSDCNLEPLQVSQAPVVQQTQLIQNGQSLQQQQPVQLNNNHNQQPQQLILIRQDNQQQSSNSSLISSKLNLNNAGNNNNNNTNTNNNTIKISNLTKNKSSPSKKRSIKLLDTTNTTGANTTATSDESLDDDISMDESSEDEKETIQIRKKPKTSFSSSVQSSNSKSKEYEESHNQQRLFNKYVRENVETRLGKEFLLLHEIQEINHDVMESIKKDALEMYPPINIRPRRAWHLAKASLRCRRRSLRRQKEKQSLINPVHNPQLGTINETNNPTIINNNTNNSGTNTNTNNNGTSGPVSLQGVVLNNGADVGVSQSVQTVIRL